MQETSYTVTFACNLYMKMYPFNKPTCYMNMTTAAIIPSMVDVVNATVSVDDPSFSTMHLVEGKKSVFTS